MVLVCALCWVSSAQGASYRWYMDTDTGKSVAMDEVEYLLRSDNSTDFSVVVKNGDILSRTVATCPRRISTR